SPRCPPSCQHNAAGGRLAPGREPDGAQVGQPRKRRLQVVRSQAGLTPYITGGLPAGVKEVRSSTLFASEANMSTSTTVVLVHGARVVRRTLPILVGLLALAAPLVGQARHGHFYHVNYYQVRPGQEKAYDSALVDVVTPVFDELVKRKAVVSYLLLTKIAGSGENTHVVIVEVATPSGTGTFQGELEAASQALFHKSWSDATVRFPELRGFMHAELYTPAGQRP